VESNNTREIISKEDRIEDMGARQVRKSIISMAIRDSKCRCQVALNKAAIKKWTPQISQPLGPRLLGLHQEIKKWSIRQKSNQRMLKITLMPMVKVGMRLAAFSNAKQDKCLCSHFSQTQSK
jgi:hypothetical protein